MKLHMKSEQHADDSSIAAHGSPDVNTDICSGSAYSRAVNAPYIGPITAPVFTTNSAAFPGAYALSIEMSLCVAVNRSVASSVEGAFYASEYLADAAAFCTSYSRSKHVADDTADAAALGDPIKVTDSIAIGSAHA